MDTRGAVRLNRPITPVGPVQAYQTYTIAAPRASHFRPAGCAEVDCPHWCNGWRTIVPKHSDLEQLVRRSGRKFIERQNEDGLVEFTFEAGQPCFRASQHQLRLDRQEIFSVRDGDWRADLGDRFVFDRPDQWTDSFARHQDKIATRIARG